MLKNQHYFDTILDIMNFAVIKASGKQYKVAPGDVLQIDKIKGESGSNVEFDEVLLVGDDKSTTIGLPMVKGAIVKAKILDQIKGEKVRVAKFKAKARYRRVMGFRAELTKIQITDILGGKN